MERSRRPLRPHPAGAQAEYVRPISSFLQELGLVVVVAEVVVLN